MSTPDPNSAVTTAVRTSTTAAATTAGVAASSGGEGIPEPAAVGDMAAGVCAPGSDHTVRGLLLRLGVKIGVCAGVVYAVLAWVCGVVFVSGEAMFPAVRDGDVAVFYRLAGAPVAGDVIVYEEQGQRLLGRVVAMSGDSVDLTDNGQLIVNGAVQQETIYVPTEPVPGGIDMPYAVGDGCVFVLGDNRPYATDSRLIGAVCEEQIHGRVVNLFRRRGI